MADDPHKTPSFTRWRRWQIGFDLSLRTVLVLAVVIMINYLGAQYFKRFYLSSQTRIQLSSRSVSVLNTLTNQVTVTLYYDRQEEFYPTILALLNEYRTVNPKITVNTVDYVRDAGAAAKIKEQYNLAGNKDLVIFDLGGRIQVVPGAALVQYKLTQVPNEKEFEFQRKPISFEGEKWFTTSLLALENPVPLKAYFLRGHGEPSLSDADPKRGYLTFGLVLRENYLTVTNLQLLGDQVVPDDCSLLIIAAPTEPLSALELQKIDQYLAQGGRLFVLLDFYSMNHPTGLEPILQRWGINVVADYVKDPNNTITGQDIKVQAFSDHPIVSGLADSTLHMILPRPVVPVTPVNASEVKELAYSGPTSTLAVDAGEPPRSYPLMVAAEQKTGAGLANPRGNTRIVAVGDSFFLGNHYIEDVGNRDFVSSAVNWLLNRTALVAGLESQNITEYRLLLSRAQQRQVRWILLGALPGLVLLAGGLVWLVRRK